MRPLTVADRDGAVDVVTSAFATYPYWVWIEPDAATRAATMRAYYTQDLLDGLAAGASHGVDLVGGDAASRRREASRQDAVLAAAAIWIRSQDIAGGFVTGAAAAIGAAAARFEGVLLAMEALAPKEPHWYLDVLAVTVEHQGAGFGTAALLPGLARADDDGLGCYLETHQPANVRFYERHGFVVRAELDHDGLHMHGMWRAPARPHRD